MGVQCVIVAGGRGTRLGSLTEQTPKPMVLVLGVPFLHWLIDRLVSQGIRRFLILSGYRASSVVQYFGDGEGLGCQISYSQEETFLGSGGALWNARHLLEKEFFYINGDDYLEIDYNLFIKKFHQKKVMALVAAYKNSAGQLGVDERTGMVKKFDGARSLSYLDCGTKAFGKEIFDLVSPSTPFNLEAALWPLLIRDQQLAFFEIKARPHAIDTVEALREFEDWIQQQGLVAPVRQ